MQRGLTILVILLIVVWISLSRLKNRKSQTTKGGAMADSLKLYGYLKDLGITSSLAKMIVAQAQHESANFESIVYRKTNNPFGMKEAQLRYTTDKDFGQVIVPDGAKQADFTGYSEYESLKDAAKDYYYYMQSVRMPGWFGSVSDFVDFLKDKGYFEADRERYKKAVQLWYDRLEV
jgi:hypothetical protein